MTVTTEPTTSNVTRTDVTFLSDTDWCAAWLYRPERPGPRPLIVMAHGFSATRELRLDAYAERFCAAGIGALVFDYRHFGASGGQPRQLLDISRQHADYRAALAYARGLDWVDADRVAVFGSSFSGGHAVAVSAKDSRVAAVIAQCPFTDGLATLPALGLAPVAKLTVAGIRDQLSALIGGPPHYVAAAGAPGTDAVMTTEDSLPGMQALVPADSLWENRVAARIALRVGIYRPGLAAAQLGCPSLFCICDDDSLAPAQRTAALAARSPQAEVKHYPVGHFDIYLPPTWDQAVADQTEFLVRHLRP